MFDDEILTRMNISNLEKKGMLQTLIFLLENGESSINGIGKNIDVTVTTLRKTTLPTLVKLGLVKYRKVTQFPKPHFYSLTDKGQELAKCLQKHFT